MITSPLFLIRQSRRVERRVRAITIAIVFFVMLGWQCGLSALAAASPVVAHFDVPGSSPRGLTWDGTHLWMVDNLKTVYQLDTSGNVLSSFKIAFSPSGMCWDGQALWIGDDTGSRQVKLDR